MVSGPGLRLAARGQLIPLLFMAQGTARSLMAASLGWMSRKGLFPTPMDTSSFRRSSEDGWTEGEDTEQPAAGPALSSDPYLCSCWLGPKGSC